jgi:hypothetical protein
LFSGRRVAGFGPFRAGNDVVVVFGVQCTKGQRSVGVDAESRGQRQGFDHLLAVLTSHRPSFRGLASARHCELPAIALSNMRDFHLQVLRGRLGISANDSFSPAMHQ